MDASENLNLPYILPSQAQKHVTHNEAIRALDAIVHLAVLSRAVPNPPAAPNGGDRYIVPSGATGAWSGREATVAAWQDGAWAFYGPRDGWLAHVLDENRMLVFQAGGWLEVSLPISIPDQVGINTSADATNRLAVASRASLFTHTGGGHQLKINKAAPGDTASLLYQTNWSGRAEMGLAGNDAFSIKVSADGSTFREAIVIDQTTGRPAFPNGAQGVRQQLAEDRTYHVAPAGSDDNDGLSGGAPFATLQKAIDTALLLDCAGHDVMIRLSDGNHAGATIARALLGGGRLTVQGNEVMPSAVVLSGGLSLENGVDARVTGMRIAIAADLVHALSVRHGATLAIGRMEFGAVGANADHIFCDSPCGIVIEDDYAITGGARRHMNIACGHLVGRNRTITLTDTPAFVQFAAASRCATIALSDATFAGGATGSRYLAETNGVIDTSGEAPTFLPGSAAGSTLSGGVYA